MGRVQPHTYGFAPNDREKKRCDFQYRQLCRVRPSPYASAYAASKAGLARLTDSIAGEVAEFGINLFCVSSGLVKTNMTSDAPVFNNLPASAWNPPEKICQLIVDILERDCSALSGRFIHADDDLDAMLEQVDKVKSEGLYQLGMYSLGGRIE